MKNKKRGFTYLELLIYMFILSIISFILLPRISFIPSFQEELKIKEILFHIKETKNQALKQHIIMTFHIKNNQYSIEDEFGNTLLEEDLSTLRLHPKNPRSKLVFTSKGRPDDKSPGKIILEGKKKYIIIIAPVTGSIRLEKSS